MIDFELSISAQALITKLVEDRVAATLAKLVVSHRNGTLSAQEALSGVATISGLRSLISDLAAKIPQKGLS